MSVKEITVTYGTDPLDPCKCKSEIGGLDCTLFKVPPEGLTEQQHAAALKELDSYITRQKKTYIGYQTNQDFNYSEDFAKYLDVHLNNVGDPFSYAYLTLNTKYMEVPVLEYYARLWNNTTPYDPKNPDSYWGYVLTMGSTEGNMVGLWNARDYLAGRMLIDDPSAPAKLKAAPKDGELRRLKPRTVHIDAKASDENPNAYTPVAFYSEDTHYSIIKIMRVLNVNTFYDLGTSLYPGQCPINGGEWPNEVPSKEGPLGPGSIDLDALEKLVEFFASRGYPIMVSFNFGSTMKSAYDDVEEGCRRLAPIFHKYGLWERKVEYQQDPPLTDVRTGYWIHVDGALGGSYMPFLRMAAERGQGPLAGKYIPRFDFGVEVDGVKMVHSLVTSGHKWIGAPWPTGVFMTRRKFQLMPPDNPAYIGSPDTTFAGSRNAQSAMILWDYIATHSYEDQIKKALYTEEIADYVYQQLKKLDEEKYGGKLWVQRTPLALAVLFRQPNQEIVFKYSLSSEAFCVDGQARTYSHVYCMQSVTKELVDQLVADLSAPDAYDFSIPLPPCSASS